MTTVRSHPHNTAGFTIIELMITISITAIITGLLISNFSRIRVDLNRATIIITDGIREAQSLALTGATVSGTSRCGYGIHFVEDGFFIYAGPESALVDCTVQDRNFDPSDEVIRSASLPNSSLEIVLPTDDIFFEPPDPTTFINGSSLPTAQSNVYVRRLGEACAVATSTPDCRVIVVTGTGRIQAQ